MGFSNARVEGDKMKKFEVFIELNNTERYDIEAEDEQEATDKALSGDYEPVDWTSEYDNVGEVTEVEKFRGEK